MSDSAELRRFTREALASGADRTFVSGALVDAGWNRAEVDRELASWIDVPGLPPVPAAVTGPQRSGSRGAARAVLLVMLVCLLGGIGTVAFWIVDGLLPDPSDTYRSLYQPRWTLACLIVAAPIAFGIARHLRGPSTDPQWFIGALFVIASLILAGDLVGAVYALLAGDMSVRFVLKAVIVAVLAGLAFSASRTETPPASFSLSVVTGILAIGVSVAAVVISGGLGEGRLERKDALRLSDAAALSTDLACKAAGASACAPVPPRTSDPFTGEGYVVSRQPGRVTVCVATESRRYALPAYEGDVPGCRFADFATEPR